MRLSNPDAVAVTCDGNALTYRELDEQANRLAHELVAAGVGPDKLVGLAMADQHTGLDRVRIRFVERAQRAMKTDHGVQRHADARLAAGALGPRADGGGTRA